MSKKYLILLLVVAFLLVTAAGAFVTREYWRHWLDLLGEAPEGETSAPIAAGEPRHLKLSPQARKNLGLVSKPITPQDFWRTIQVPGVIVDRPGVSDRNVPAPAGGVVAKVHAFPGDTVRPGDRLFTLRLNSEYLQNAQTELFKTTREIQLTEEQRKALTEAGLDRVTPARALELDNQLRRLAAVALAYRQDLQARGLSPAHVESAATGRFVTEIEVFAPERLPEDRQLITQSVASLSTMPPSTASLAYEVHELKAELGQQVQAGQTLCLLANHQALYIEGRSFKREAVYLGEAARQGWPVRAEISEDDASQWPSAPLTLTIRHLANTVDPASRTFSFYLPLSNQSRSFERDGRTYLLWRFRPGQRVRLQVPVEQLKNVLVVPASAVAREGPEAYVFRQNGDLFERRPVQVLHEDRDSVVLASDGSVEPRLDFLAQNAAASLNRILKAQNSSGGLPPGFHVHADGTVHGPH